MVRIKIKAPANLKSLYLQESPAGAIPPPLRQSNNEHAEKGIFNLTLFSSLQAEAVCANCTERISDRYLLQVSHHHDHDEHDHVDAPSRILVYAAGGGGTLCWCHLPSS